MTCKGRVRNGVIVLEGGASLPEGTEVRVEPVEATEAVQRLREGLRKLSGAVSGFPSDMARNHDHYIHGTPKK